MRCWRSTPGSPRPIEQLLVEAGLADDGRRAVWLLSAVAARWSGASSDWLRCCSACRWRRSSPRWAPSRRYCSSSVEAHASGCSIFEEQFPEAIDLIARALRAGHAFTTGLGIAAEEMPAPVGTEFKRVYDQQNFGMSLPDALRAMAHRVPVLDARFFVTAVLTQRESGGNLAEVLDNLSAVMRERFKVKRQIRVDLGPRPHQRLDAVAGAAGAGGGALHCFSPTSCAS